MDYKLTKLTSGLRVLTVPMPSSESVTLTVWVKTGSRNEEKRVNGISHFLEHMVFKGSKKRPTAKEISETVDSMGAECNAGTNKDWTNFYIKSRNAKLSTSFDVLADMVLNPILDTAEIEREKGTIIQEIAMYEDTPMMNIGNVFENLTYEGNNLGWDIAGDAKSVTNIKKDDFESYRKRYYYTDNMLVSVAGGVTSKTAIGLAQKFFAGVQNKKERASEGKNFVPNQSSPRVRVKNKKSDQAHFILGFMGDGRNYKGRFAQGILSVILGGGMSSRMFTEVRERRGLAYGVRTSIDRYQDTGYIGTYVGTDPKKAEEAVKIVLEEHYKLANKQKPVSTNEFSKAKEYLKGHAALVLEDTSAVGEYFAFQELFGKEILTPEEYFKRIDKVTLDEVYFEAKRMFDPKKLNLGMIGPFTETAKFEKLLK